MKSMTPVRSCRRGRRKKYLFFFLSLCLLFSVQTGCSGSDKAVLTIEDFLPGVTSASCTVSISCSEIPEHKEDYKGDLSEIGDGEILSETKVPVYSNDTVLDVFLRVCDENSIDYYNRNGYIASINGISEFDCGPLSGWTYTVNGEFADVGASKFPVKDGDVICWSYSCTYPD